MVVNQALVGAIYDANQATRLVGLQLIIRSNFYVADKNIVPPFEDGAGDHFCQAVVVVCASKVVIFFYRVFRVRHLAGIQHPCALRKKP